MPFDNYAEKSVTYKLTFLEQIIVKTFKRERYLIMELIFKSFLQFKS